MKDTEIVGSKEIESISNFVNHWRLGFIVNNTLEMFWDFINHLQ